ncbi:ABC transporter permease [Micromonospora sp. CPCC 205371]|nr:ABC transporter permease [Micromonospora sp. CPCC 205371]
MSDVITRTAAETAAPVTLPRIGLAGYLGSFRGLLIRDVRVLTRDFVGFVMQTVMQPLLFVFVFAYVFPKINQAFSGPDGGSFATVMTPGVVATAAFFTGISSVAMPLSVDFGATREIEDRVTAPLPVWAVGFEKVLFGAFQSLIAALVVYPLVYFVPATPVSVHVDNWALLVAVTLVICLTSGALGLLLGSIVRPGQIGMMYGVLVVPLSFLGCVYYPWQSLQAVPWLQVGVLVNPLVYASEGLRHALTPQLPHMPAWAHLGAGVAILAALLFGGLRLFERRVLS